MHPRRPLLVLLTTAVAAFSAAPAAHAGDLIALDGDPAVEMAGSNGFGIVYVDTDLRLTGDTSIHATSVYLGPHARLISCFVPPNADDGCTHGRSLTIVSTGPVSIANAVSLQPSASGAGDGGSLTISGTTVSLGDAVDVSGRGAGQSGSVGISASDRVDVQSIAAHGGGIALAGPNGVRAAELRADAPGDAAAPANGGPITVSSPKGDVIVRGAVTNAARGGAGVTAGGSAVPIAITAGGAFRAASVSAVGGAADAGLAGGTGSIAITTGGALTITGNLDVFGAQSNGGPGGSAGALTLKAGGAVTLSTVNAGGGRGAAAGAGSKVAITGSSIDIGEIGAQGGDATDGTGAGHAGAPGGSIVLTSAGDVQGGDLQAQGGGSSSETGQVGGAGGAITVTGDHVDVGDVRTSGGNSSATGANRSADGAPGGPIWIVGRDGLAVGGRIDAGASNSAGPDDAPANGGKGGDVTLSGGLGTLRTIGVVSTQGSNGHGTFGVGGKGGGITIAGLAIAVGAGIVADGGAGSGAKGPGGAGGAVVAFTDTDLFSGLVSISSIGGGNSSELRGADGVQRRNAAPTDFAITGKTFGFTNKSPDADGFRLLLTLPGAEPTAVWTGTQTSGIALPKAPACLPASYTVQTYRNDLGWATSSAPPVAVTPPPSPGQTCTAPARARLARPVRTTTAALTKAKGKVSLRLTVKGVGMVAVTILRGKARVASLPARAVVGKPATFTVTLPRSAWSRAATYTVRITGTAPVGKAVAKTTGQLVVAKSARRGG